MSSEQQGSVAAKLSQQFVKNIKKTLQKQQALLTKLRFFCAQQDFGLRGHRETKKVCFETQNKGNVIALVDLTKKASNEMSRPMIFDNLPKNAT